MKKTKIFLPFVALALTFGLVACGGGGQASGGSNASGGQQSNNSQPAKPKITVSAAGDKKSLLKGETVQLSAKDGEAALEGVKWSSSAPAVASVSEDGGLVSALTFGEATITAKKDGYTNGTITINVTRPAPTKVLHMEDAEHEAADGEWSSSNNPTDSPVYNKDNASDGTTCAHFGAGDVETMRFTASKAVKAEIVLKIGYYYSIEDLTTIYNVKFNNVAVNFPAQSYESEDTTNYTYKGLSFGELDLIAGTNVLEITMKENTDNRFPYMDDLEIYAAEAVTIELVPAPVKQAIAIAAPTSGTTIEAESTLQLRASVDGVTWASSNEAVATVDASGLVTGVAKGTAYISARKEGMKTGRVEVTVTEKLVAGEIRVQAESGKVDGVAVSADTDIKVRTASSGETLTERWAHGKTLVVTFSSTKAGSYKLYLNGRAGGQYGMSDIDDLAAVIEVKCNSTAVSIPANTAITGRTFTDYLLGNVTLKVGDNTIEVKALGEEDDKAPNIDFFKLTPNA